jgi:hypothetical protein
MDWIESWFGISPDGGNGVSELLIVVAGVAIVIAVVPALRQRAVRLLRRIVAPDRDAQSKMKG